MAKEANIVVVQQEVVAARFKRGDIPIGTPVRYSDYSVQDNHGYETHVMVDGVFVGQELLGGATLLLFQRTDKDGQPVGFIKEVTPRSLQAFIDIVEVPADAEMVTEPDLNRLAPAITGQAGVDPLYLAQVLRPHI